MIVIIALLVLFLQSGKEATNDTTSPNFIDYPSEKIVQSAVPSFQFASLENPYSGSGDWSLFNSEVIENQIISVSGNIRILATGLVHIKNTTINFDGTLFIETPNHIIEYSNLLSSSAGNAVTITSENITIIGTTLTGGSSNALYLENASNNTIYNNRIVSNIQAGDAAIRMSTSHQNNISQNYISFQSYGIRLDLSDENIVEKNMLFQDPKDGFGDRALLSITGDRNILKFNQLLTSEIATFASNGIQMGIGGDAALWAASDNILLGNILYNGTNVWIGGASDKNQLINNTISGDLKRYTYDGSTPNNNILVGNKVGSTTDFPEIILDDPQNNTAIDKGTEIVVSIFGGTGDFYYSWNKGGLTQVNDSSSLFADDVNHNNLQIWVSDLYNNTVSQTYVFNIIDDLTVPQISGLGDTTIINGSIGNLLTWHISDENPANYELYEDTILRQSGSWLNDIDVVINIDYLSVGTYNFTLIAFDLGGNLNRLSITVFVIDSDTPVILGNTSVMFEEDAIGKTLNWTLNDLNPDFYELFLNGSQIGAGTWIAGQTISIVVDTSLLINFNYTIVAHDTSLLKSRYTTLVTIEDNLKPNLIFSPSNATINATAQYIGRWTATDKHPSSYSFSINGVTFQLAAWTTGLTVDITLNLPTIDYGMNEIIIIFYDTSANSQSHTFYLNVVDNIPPTITHPDNTQYFQGEVGNSIVWVLADHNPGIYNITVNDSILIPDTTWTGGELNLNVDGFKFGNYEITIRVLDLQGNDVSDSVLLTVIETSSTPSHSSTESTTSETSIESTTSETSIESTTSETSIESTTSEQTITLERSTPPGLLEHDFPPVFIAFVLVATLTTTHKRLRL